MNRRHFLQVSAAAGGGLLLQLSVAEAAAPRPVAAPTELNALLTIAPDGTVYFQFINHEMGQQLSNAFAQVVAEELGADWSKVVVQTPPADPKFKAWGDHGTGGSGTTIRMWPQLRKAGATARYLLTQAAARRWQVPVADCRVERHRVLHPPTGRSLGFGELAAEAARLPLPEGDIPLKATEAFTLVGKPFKGKNVPQIVRGKQTYGLDVHVPGMHYAVIERCPVRQGSVRSFNAEKTRQVAEVVAVVPVKGYQTEGGFLSVKAGVAVVATSFWAAEQWRRVLEVNWEEGPYADLDDARVEAMAEEALRAETKPNQFLKGDPDAIQKAARVIEATYTYPYQAHACMEPMNCTAHHQGDRYTLWLSAQMPGFVAEHIQHYLGLPPERGVIHRLPSGGSFGRRFYPDPALEALAVSEAIGHKPVQVIWTRSDDIRHDHFQFYSKTRIRAGLDANNRLESLYIQDGRSGFGAEQMWNGYDIPHIREDFVNLFQALQPGAWRSVVNNSWGFALESLIDELAHETGTDPLAFRLAYLAPDERISTRSASHPIQTRRMRQVLELAAEKAGWGKPKQPDTALGLSVYPYLHANSYCAQVAEVGRLNGRLRIQRITCVVDCGKVINPLFLKQQIQGGIIWSLSALLHGNITLRNGRVQQSNFHDFPILRHAECPPIDIHIVEGDESPGGAGEVSVPGTIPAVCNALFRLTGQRIRRLPIALDAM